MLFSKCCFLNVELFHILPILQFESKKTKEEYASVMNHMRTRIRFSIMRSVLVALRGQRGKPTTSAKPLAVTSFDLIPQSMAYESY